MSTYEGLEDIIGVSNIFEDPLFVDPDNGDFSLQEGSPCIDTGKYDVWNLDPDGSTADMGANSGSSILPNFIEYDFGQIGDIVSTANFKLYNFGDDDIISIDAVSFSTNHFTTSTDFPVVIPPLSTGVININFNLVLFRYGEIPFILSVPLIKFLKLNIICHSIYIFNWRS